MLFLSSPAGPAQVYTYEVPTGTAFLLTVGSAAFWVPDDFSPGTPIEDLRAAAASVVDLISVAECTIDGSPVSSIFRYRAISPVFFGYLNPTNPFGYPGGYDIGPAAADGLWIMIPPLNVGAHEIYFHSIVGDPGDPLFEADATHFVTVMPRGAGKEALAIEPTTWGAIKAVYR